jgi:hypothetical protein
MPAMVARFAEAGKTRGLVAVHAGRTYMLERRQGGSAAEGLADVERG